MARFKIVELAHQDLDVSIQIRDVLFEAYSVEAQLIGADKFPPLDRLAAEIAASQNRFFGVIENDDLLAVVELEKRNQTDSSAGISSLCVAPRHTRKGLGAALLQFVLSLGEPVVEVSTAAANAPAIALYQKSGFKIIKSETNQHGIAVVHLTRQKETSDPGS